MGHKKVGVPSRRYTSEFKIEAVKLGHSVGMSEASRRLGIPDSSLFNWVRLERKGKLGTSASVSRNAAIGEGAGGRSRSIATRISLSQSG